MGERHVSGDRLSAFLDDELGEAAALAAARHIGVCEHCLRELEALRATRDALRRLPTLTAPLLVRGELGHHRHAGRPRRPRRVVRLARRAAIVCVLPLVAGVFVYLAGGDPGNVEPTTELFLVEHVGRTGGGPVPAPVGGGGR